MEDPTTTLTQQRIPITVISGFLGAGKTSLLRHILQNQEGYKFGVVVNDMASTNIDAKMVRQTGAQNKDSNSVFNPANTVELDNGCVCCNLNGELLQVVFKLSQKGSFDRIVVECTGVAEPKSLVDAFAEAEENQDPAVAKVVFDNVVTVVDSSAFVTTFQSKDIVEDRPDLADGEGSGEDRHVVDLLVEQIEAADTLVLNKSDTMKPKQMERLQATVSELNSTAAIVTSSYGAVQLADIFSKKTTKKEKKSDECTSECKDAGHGHGHGAPAEAAAHGHSHAHGHGHDHANNTTAAKRFNISSFTYNRRRPFSASRLALVLQALPASVGKCVVPVNGAEQLAEVEKLKPLFQTVIRSKGFCWLDSMPKAALYWAQAGNFFEMQGEGAWWADAAASAMPEDEEVRSKIMEDFKDPYGDRRQEIVFIGIQMKQADIVAALDVCVLNDEEMKAYDQTQSDKKRAVEK